MDVIGFSWPENATKLVQDVSAREVMAANVVAEASKRLMWCLVCVSEKAVRMSAGCHWPRSQPQGVLGGRF